MSTRESAVSFSETESGSGTETPSDSGLEAPSATDADVHPRVTRAVDSPRGWRAPLAFGVLTIALAVVAGPAGVLACLGIVLVWYALGTPYALAVGSITLLALFPTGIDPRSLAIVTGAFVACLLASTTEPGSSSPVRSVTVALVSVVGLVGTTWVVLSAQPLWVGALVLVALFTLVAYTLHRFELVRFGLVSADSPQDPTHDHTTEEHRP